MLVICQFIFKYVRKKHLFFYVNAFWQTGETIVWTLAGILLIRSIGTNFSEILSEVYALSFKKMDFKMSCAKWRQFCRGPDVLNDWWGSIWWYVSNKARQPEYALKWRHNGRDHV